MGFERLKKNKDFTRVYNRGESYGCKNLVIYSLPNKDQFRVGFSISKKVGNAVIRNRIRRYLKESLRLLEPQGQGCDIIFIARKPARDNNFFEIKRSVQYLFKKIGLQYDENNKQGPDSTYKDLSEGNFSAKGTNL